MENVDDVIDPRLINDTIPDSLILIPQFEGTRANGRQWPVIAWPFALLQLPKFESKILPYLLRKGLEGFPGIAFPSDGGVIRNFRWIAHKGEDTRKRRFYYTRNCISRSREKLLSMILDAGHCNCVEIMEGVSRLGA